MAAVSETYPIDPDLPAVVRGDPLAIPITFADETDIAGWTFRSHVRRWPDGAIVTIAGVGIVGNTVQLTLTEDQTALLTGDEGFDLEQLTPTHRTWWIVRRIRVEKDYSHA